MNKRKIITVLTVLSLVMVMVAATCTFTACGAELDSISLNTNSVTTEYTVGDTFSAAGLKVTGNMTDGSTVEIAPGDCKISNPNMTVAGEKEITVTYNEKSAKFKITVKEKNVKPPIEWHEDFTIDPSGSNKVFALSAVKAALDGSDRLGPSDVDPEHSVGGMIVGDKVIFMIGSAAAGKAQLWFNFDHTGHGGTAANRLIKTTVNDKELVTEAEFAEGEEGHAHANWMCYQKTLLGEIDISAGRNTITFEFLGNGSNLKEIILDFSDGSEVPAELTGIKAATTKADFYREDAFTTEGVTVTAAYSDNTERSIALADCEFTAPDMSTAGEKAVTVTYGGKTATYNITVGSATRFNAAPTDEVKKFTFDAVYALLDDTVKTDIDDNSIGGIAQANAPSVTFKFDSTVAGKAKLLFDCDHTYGGTNVDVAMDTFVNGEKKTTGANFVEPPLGHTHTDWHCFYETELAVVDVKAGLNTVKFNFKIDFTNVRAIALDFDLSDAPPAPAEKTYRFEAENALLANCMVEYSTASKANGNMLVGDMGTEGAAAKFTVYADKAGSAKMTIKYANSKPSVLGDVFTVTVGSSTLDLSAVNVPAGSGASWYEWTAGTVNDVALVQGENVITVARPAAGGGANFDYIELTSEAVLTDKAPGETVYKFDGTVSSHSEEVTDEAGHEGWLGGIVDGSTVSFTFNADKATTGILTFLMDHNKSTKPLVDKIIDIEVNGEKYTSSAQLGYCSGTCPDNLHHAIACNLGVIELRADQPNTVKFTFKSSEGCAPSNFNGITVSTTAVLTAVTA